MFYSPTKAPLTEEQGFKSRELYNYAYFGRLDIMIDILRSDNVGIADYHHGNFENPMATTLTVYLEACQRKNKDALYGTELLVRHGANVSTIVTHGESAMSLAVQFDMVSVARYLIENGGEIEVYLFRSVEMMKLFIENGFEIRSHTSTGLTLLQDVEGVSTKASDLRHFIVAHGCDIDELSKKGDTALHLAVYSGNTECVTDLCHMGARLDIRNAEGKTPLQVAIYLCGEGGPDKTYVVWKASTKTWQTVTKTWKVEKAEIKKILEEEPMRKKTIDYI